MKWVVLYLTVSGFESSNWWYPKITKIQVWNQELVVLEQRLPTFSRHRGVFSAWKSHSLSYLNYTSKKWITLEVTLLSSCIFHKLLFNSEWTLDWNVRIFNQHKWNLLCAFSEYNFKNNARFQRTRLQSVISSQSHRPIMDPNKGASSLLGPGLLGEAYCIMIKIR